MQPLQAMEDFFRSPRSFYIISALVLLIMLLMNVHTRPTYDEAIERAYGKAALSYYLSGGQDTSFLDPYTEGWDQSFPEMRYYGTGFELIPAMYTRWISDQNEFLLRHVLNTLTGFLAFLFAALILISLEGFLAGNIVMLALLISPTFIGLSALENKAIPLTLGYTASVYFLVRILDNLPRIKWPHALGAVLSIALAVSIRVAGLITVFYYAIFVFLVLFRKDLRRRKLCEKARILGLIALCCTAGAAFGLLFYPNFLYTGWEHITESLHMVRHFKPLYLLFEGRQISNQTAPWYYIFKIFGMTAPVVLLAGMGLALITYPFRRKYKLAHLVIFFVLLFPVITLTLQNASVYNGWRHVAFIYPAFCMTAVIGFMNYFALISNSSLRIFSVLLILALVIKPLSWYPENFRYNYAYYNLLSGNYRKNIWGKYEIDFYSLGTLHCYDWLYHNRLKESDEPITISCNNPVLIEYAKDRGWIRDNIRIEFNPFNAFSLTDWDYCILSPRLISLKILDRFYPPKKTIYRDGIKRVTVAALVERENKYDFEGNRLINRNRPQEALPLLEKAFEYNPNNYQVWYLLGLAHLFSDHPEEAIRYLLPYYSIHPVMNSHYYLGLAYFSNNQHSEALKYLEPVLINARNPSMNRMARLYSAQSSLALGDPGRALALLEEGLSQYPDDRAFLSALVNTCNQMGDTERADMYLRQLQNP